jgi:hypothetical protein
LANSGAAVRRSLKGRNPAPDRTSWLGSGRLRTGSPISPTASVTTQTPCSAPTAMSSNRWCWQSATITRQERDCRSGTQQRPAAALDRSPVAALHRHFQVPHHDQAPRRSVRSSARQQGCRSRDVQAANPNWLSSHTCLKCSISSLNPSLGYPANPISTLVDAREGLLEKRIPPGNSRRREPVG